MPTPRRWKAIGRRPELIELLPSIARARPSRTRTTDINRLDRCTRPRATAAPEIERRHRAGHSARREKRQPPQQFAICMIPASANYISSGNLQTWRELADRCLCRSAPRTYKPRSSSHAAHYEMGGILILARRVAAVTEHIWNEQLPSTDPQKRRVSAYEG